MKQELLKRDKQIYDEYLAGSNTAELAGFVIQKILDGNAAIILAQKGD